MIIIAIICIAMAAAGFLFWASASIRSGIYVQAFCRERTDRKTVYLTFDDGPVRSSTSEVLDVLHARGACATFFMIGANVTGNEDVVRRVIAEGHRVGIHSFSHAGMFPLYSTERMIKDITECRDVLAKLAGEDVKLFRPPFGVVNPTVARAARRCGLHTVGWSVRSFDTMHTDSSTWQQDTLDRIMRHLEPGAVILLHDRLPHAAGLLSALLDRLASEGYRFDIPLPVWHQGK